MFTSELVHFNAGITGSAVIPVFQMTGPVTDELRPAMEAGTLVVRMDGDFGPVRDVRPGHRGHAVGLHLPRHP